MRAGDHPGVFLRPASTAHPTIGPPTRVPFERSVCYYDAAGDFLGYEVDVVDGTLPAATARYNVNGIGADIRWTITAA